MTIGQVIGENLVVKEGCINKDETSCAEKVKYISAKPGRIGRIEFPVNLTGNFDITMGLDANDTSDGNRWGENIVLHSDDGSLPLSFNLTGHSWGLALKLSQDQKFLYASETNSTTSRIGWSGGSAINDIRMKVESGQAAAAINDRVLDDDGITEFSVDPNRLYNRLVIGGIKEVDRLFEIKVRGLQTACNANPISGSTVTPVESSQLPTIAPNLNLHIPTIEYQSLGGKMNLWVDLQFTTTDDGKMWWMLDDFGVNP